MPERVPTVAVNGTQRECSPAYEETLLEWLRERLGLTGTKYGCGEAACGACSVLVDGVLTRACVTPAGGVAGRSVTTVEGLADDHALQRVQHAFLETGAMQCGYCTPGMVIAATALLDAHPQPHDDEIAEWMAPNVCRCGVYPRIVDAIRRAAAVDASTRTPAPAAADVIVFLRAPQTPWDLVEPRARDYFEVLGDGIVVVTPPPATAPDAWNPTGGAWLHVSPTGTVTAFTGKVEVGQGTRGALRVLVAEEMGVPATDVRVVMGDTDVCPFDIGTFGSLGMPTAAADLRRAAAATREVRARLGTVPTGLRHLEVVNDPAPTPATQWRRAEHATSHGDVRAVTGSKQFVSDIAIDGMRHGAVLRPPCPGARLIGVDTAGAGALADVHIVVDGDFVGVVAPDARRAHAAIDAVDATWSSVDAVAEAELETFLRTHPVEGHSWSGAVAHESGDVDAALESAAVSLTTTYTCAYIAHAPMETRAAVAAWSGDRLTVWTATQRPFGTRDALANALSIDEAAIRVVVPDSGTGFGGKHEPDVAIAAARLARDAGAPVKVHWTREEEFTHAYFRPAAVIDVRAGATSDGNLTAWDFVNINSGGAALGTPYDVPSRRVRYQPAASPLRQGSYRALAATANNFARESAMDELAHELRVDAKAFRLQHLTDERLAAVLEGATAEFEWDDRPQPEPGYGSGLALGCEKGGRVASCVSVQVNNGDVRILRIVTAFECGAIVHPDNLRSQITGATIMGIGGALFEAVHFDAGRIVNPRFSEYRVPRFTDIGPIDVVLVDRPDLPSAGAGETPIIAIAPALAGALFEATGRRLRSLPLLADKDALAPTVSPQ
jgi:isoquinoline 1-oxidoreductase